MQEDSYTANENTTDGRQHDADVVRHRRLSRFAGRSRHLVLGAVALIGLSVAGVSFVTVGAENGDPAPAAVALDEQARAGAADRADRADREPLPTPSATVTTPAPASPTASPTRSSSPAAKATARATKAPAAPKPKPKPKAAWVNPMPSGDVTSCYGMRWGVLHAGIDLAAPAGTKVHAAAAGTVVNAGWDFAGYGISVVIDHGNGYLTHYAHLSSAAVSVGGKVSAGQVVGYEGSTGDSTGPHLHFEVHQGQLWSQIEPAAFMKARGVNLGC